MFGTHVRTVSLIAATALLVVGCGGKEQRKAPAQAPDKAQKAQPAPAPTTQPGKTPAATIKAYWAAIEKKDFAQACALLSDKAQQELQETSDKPCAKVLPDALAFYEIDLTPPISVEVERTDNEKTLNAIVTAGGAETQFSYQMEKASGGWLIADEMTYEESEETSDWQ